MTLQRFLADLHERGVHLYAEGDRLRCTAPPGVLTPQLRDRLQQHKDEILEVLRSGAALARQQRAIVPLERRGTRTPVFAVAGHNGDVFCYRALAQHLGDHQPFFGLEPPGLDGRSEPLTRVEDLAAYFAEQIRAFQPDGQYILAGFCAGGTVAFELARQLLQGGASPAERGVAAIRDAGVGVPGAVHRRVRRPRRLRQRHHAARALRRALCRPVPALLRRGAGGCRRGAVPPGAGRAASGHWLDPLDLPPPVVAVAQSVRAPDCGSGGCGFDSRQPP